MTGLDKIIEQIRQEAEQAAQEQIRQGREQADKLLQEGRRQAQEKADRLSEAAQRDAEDLAARLQSATALECRKRVLLAKQRLIGEVIEQAKQSLYELPDNEYFALLERMIKTHALSQSGELKLSSKDLNRLPSGFLDRVAKSIPAGGRLRLSEQAAQIDGGFVLVYGGIEENCSFEALFEANQEQMQDKVQSMLFHA
ncbi:MAG: hypothetical protein HFE39_08685 [Clostridiales bacterium]|jgi:V/A-type H+-transporting ATPase subunit E|nr:hypothetical protein [Clostridiales bacterium]